MKMARVQRYVVLAASALAAAGLVVAAGAVSQATPPTVRAALYRSAASPVTPIKHLVVIFNENNSFDHYFGTYPRAENPPGEPRFVARSDTPAVNGLTPALLAYNPNTAAPFRLDRAMARTCDNDNHYRDEQQAYDAGLLDRFVA